MLRSRVLAGLAALATFVALLVPTGPADATPPSVEPDLSTEVWMSSFTVPWDIAFTPDGWAIVPERDTGDITVRSPGGTTRDITADMSDLNPAGEGGLMGLVVDPDFDQNRRFYTCHTTNTDVEVVAWTMNNGYTAATRVNDPLINGIDRTSGRHSGCRLRFGWEGYLWVATGDAALGTTPQDLNSLAGKVLRVDPETGAGHPKNPFVGRAGDDRIYSYGHRNPQGLDRRPCTKQMWTGEHGPGGDDEINLLKKGGDYGWNPVSPGNPNGYNENVPMTDTSLPGPQQQAKWASGFPTVALSGVGWIRGADWGGWDGELAGATLKNQRLMVFEFRNNNALRDVDIPPELNGSFGRLRTAVMGPDGALYVASDGARSIIRVTAAAGPTPGDQDINGDGFDDLVVGAPGKDIGSRNGAGGFTALYGGANSIRPNANGSEFRSQDNVKGASPQTGDAVGSAIAYGDIDGDGLTDVVVGAPDEGVSGNSDSGAIHVICGRTAGVEGRSSMTLSQAGSVAGAAETNDNWGGAVAVGDFDGDGYDDIAVGAPGETLSGAQSAGAVTILYGTPAGVTSENSHTLSQTSAGGPRGANNRFGASLATGDFDGDGRDDLAVGAPGTSVSGANGAGTVTVFYGAASGLSASGADRFDQTNSPGDNGAGDGFGTALAAGDFDGDNRDDLVIGSPGENVGSAGDAGGVAVLYGAGGGLSTSGGELFTQGGGVSGASETGDELGAALEVGDFDGDGNDDLAIGSPGENNSRGRVVILEGNFGGLDFAQSFSAAGPVAGKSENGDMFGAALRSGDYDNDGRDDLAIGVPGENAGGRADTGSVVVVDGSASGLVRSDSRAFNQASSGVAGARGANDLWGFAL